jgi:hypothetical protein
LKGFWSNAASTGHSPAGGAVGFMETGEKMLTMQTRYGVVGAVILTVTLFGGMAGARALYDTHADFWGQSGLAKPTASVTPNTQFEVHSIGKIAMTITNFGAWGTGYVGSPIVDGEQAPSCEYPNGSDLDYLFTSAILIGAVVGRDTLVSVAADGWAENTKELWPDAGPAGAIISRSNLKSKTNYDPNAVSEQDFLCNFTDTFPSISGQDGNDNRPHIPLNIRVQQNSYAWSYDYAEDFILFDFQVSNIGVFPIKNLFMALYVDADVSHRSNTSSGYSDDICGFRRTVSTPPGSCIKEDSVNIAWIGDNDGDPVGTGNSMNWSFTSPVAVTGTCVVRTPSENLKYSFNWWISNGDAALDFGPRMAGTPEYPFRPFGSHLGTPTGDKNKYYIMSHPEFDYDQLYSAVSHTGEGFLPPPRPDQAENFADGYDTRYLLSFGPFDVAPGDTIPITLAYLAGDKFHVKPRDFVDNFDAFNPDVFYKKLDFTDFGLNARWAKWIFDNPGYDTDGDKDSGKFCWNYIYDGDVIVDSTKSYYAGDGVPDFRGASPPPPPKLKVVPGFGKVTLHWNGQETENSIDVFSGQKDFEGYRAYYAQGNRASDYVLLSSYDLDDYKVFEFVQLFDTMYWQQASLPIKRDSLQKLYGPDFEPYDYYDQFHAFTEPGTDRLLYFIRQDWNQSNLTDPSLIHRVYPEATKNDPADTTAEGWLRFYEYEYEVSNLQPSVPYNFSVTAFDYGSLKMDLGALESSPLVNAVSEYPLTSAETVEEQGLQVMVYPNPYRIDGGYAKVGYENRDRTKAAERTRAIHFANLPRVCKIRIFSIDGDLVQELDHYYPDGGPGSQHETWNVISRNTQAVVTGIYLWHVQSDMGEQMGKLVIIK